MFKEKIINKRSIKKTITWRIIATIITGIIIFSFTGKLSEASYITIVNAIALTIVYYLHERFWSKRK